MRILFASSNHLPEIIGGLPITTHQLARRLTARGHSVAVLTAPFPWWGKKSIWDKLRRRWLMLRDAPLHDRKFAYDVFRALDPARSLEIVRKKFRPDVLVINAGDESFSYPMMRAGSGIPTIVYFHGGVALPLMQRSDFRANLALTVAPHLTAAAADLGYRAEVITPLLETQEYQSPASRQVVLLINPIPQKGVDIAWAIAERRPDIPFVFLEAWRLDRRTMTGLRERSRHQKNVQIRRAMSDPAQIYADARILLAPYPALEGSPRVVAEAQALGIPVVATDVPSLRFTAGDGAVFVKEQASIEDWEAAVSMLWDDKQQYERYAQAALRHATRPDVQPAHVVEQFEQAIAHALAAAPLELVRLR